MLKLIEILIQKGMRDPETTKKSRSRQCLQDEHRIEFTPLSVPYSIEHSTYVEGICRF
jgi:hypothetical protein